MTNVIAFKARERRWPSEREEPFQLLFFTGIRYVRSEETSPAKPRKPRAARRKKRA